jgi:hypothetical protein
VKVILFQSVKSERRLAKASYYRPIQTKRRPNSISRALVESAPVKSKPCTLANLPSLVFVFIAHEAKTVTPRRLPAAFSRHSASGLQQLLAVLDFHPNVW